MAARNHEDPPENPHISRVTTDLGDKARRLMRVDQMKDRQVHFVPTARARTKPDRSGNTALIVRRIISKQGMVADTEIDVKSSVLKDALLEIFEGVEGLGLNKSPPTSTPHLLFHAKDALYTRKEAEKDKPTPDKVLINDIGTALRFVAEDFGSQIANLESLVVQNEITWDLLWCLFPPNEIAISMEYSHLKQKQAFKVVTGIYSRREDGSRYYELSGKIVTHDGEDLGKGTINLQINEFEGAQKITTLKFFPLRNHPDRENIERELNNRGRAYLKLLKKSVCKEYGTGTAVTERELVDGKARIDKFYARGRIMVDPEGYQIHAKYHTLRETWVHGADLMTPEKIADDCLLLCAGWINGFSLSQKTWGSFAVSAIGEVTWNLSAFEKVVIDTDRRELIHGLVRAHRNDESSFDDIVENKGQGLVGLLSGSPGVGKTLTAEAVAEVTQRPLYCVSAGELGVDPNAVDDKLNMVLEITKRWGCVLLIDEADTFLAERGTDLSRDVLVNIFLRRIEYFMGILLLTTNRASKIDFAFQSRIHFKLHYENLDETSRLKIWKTFINKITDTAEGTTLTEEDISLLAKKPLNGRQIKNAVSCAVSLARDQKRPVNLKNIETILKLIE
ncbi:hypothetical protein HYFRA_00001737 [Hymenoscyphus fraxineus]|uniref:AAA+ ATPase domain-containing protein n=1 Tax=Hymenoscyphus fraxineus TaxID=746836 RepID=A0A9N9L658_9HELO|nr:hypothetical protein HYFRA_00001737 [Hymenoscyphus fraxineus]